MRLVHLAVVVAVAAGCSGGDAPESADTATPSSNTGTASADTATATDGEVIGADPIMAVTVAHDVGPDGVPIDPAIEYASSDEQITVIARVGEVEPDVPLEVAWAWLDGPDGEQPLFEHEIDVEAGDAAYSHGIASGPVAAGRYRATVSLGTATGEALFAVRPDPITFPELVSGFVRVADPEEPAPPSGGTSGSIPAPRDSTASAVCQPWVQATSLLAMTGADNCGDNEFEVTASVGGKPPVARYR